MKIDSYNYKNKAILIYRPCNMTFSLDVFDKLSTGDLLHIVKYAKKWLADFEGEGFSFVKSNNKFSNQLHKLLGFRKIDFYKGYNLYVWLNQ